MKVVEMSKNPINDSLETKDLILAISEKLFSLYGYIGVSMRTIAESLNISKPALYYHFKSKQELYFEVLTHSSNEFIESLEEVVNQTTPLKRKLRDVIIVYLDYCSKKKDMVHLMMQKVSEQDREVMDFVSGISKNVINLLEPLIKELLIVNKKMKKVDSQFVTRLFIGIMNSFIISESLAGKSKYNSKQVADQIIELSFNK